MGKIMMIWVLGLGLTSVGWAQDVIGLPDTQTNVPYFFHFQPGDETVQVTVWGSVAQPGNYIVTAGTDLGAVLRLAGGPPVGVTESRTRLTITIELYRENAGRRSAVYAEPFEVMLQEPGRNPVLQDGDVVMVEMLIKRRFDWRDGLRIMTAMTSLLVLVDRVGDVF